MVMSATPIFDEMVAELPDWFEPPGCRAIPESYKSDVSNWTLAQRGFQTLPLDGLSYTVERCFLPSEETRKMTPDPIPGGQEHGVIIPVPADKSPYPSAEQVKAAQKVVTAAAHQNTAEMAMLTDDELESVQDKAVAAAARGETDESERNALELLEDVSAEQALRSEAPKPHVLTERENIEQQALNLHEGWRCAATKNYDDYSHSDGRGIRAWFDKEGSIDRASFFFMGERTAVATGRSDVYWQVFDAIASDVYWPQAVKARERLEAEDVPVEYNDTSNLGTDPAKPILPYVEGARWEESLVEQVGRHHAHPEPVDDGKYVNPGAERARRAAAETTQTSREDVTVYNSEKFRDWLRANNGYGGGRVGVEMPDGTIRVDEVTEVSAGHFRLPPDAYEQAKQRIEALTATAKQLLGEAQAPGNMTGTVTSGLIGAKVEDVEPPKTDRNAEQQILDDAEHTISWDRTDDYGAAEDSFETIATMWSAYLGARLPCVESPLDGRDVAQMMVLLKVARDAKGRKRDNLVDEVGYAALAERAVRSTR